MCLIAGVSEADFWELTVGEAARACDAFHSRRKDRAYFAYTEAMTIGLFVGSMFSKHDPPKIYEVYPELFPDGEEKAEDAKIASAADNFLKFANAFNQRYEPNGNGKPESENNG